ncbi:putative cytochrome P450 [Helianthus annuus]|uniref:Cytochrome P450 n=1 Tax=Helianthus annuus TaxID=4232 RepID=A0A9K3I9Q2_HELAN|nr:putative cytochrome P450 [Helianthus annuus]KAJ0894834.1 putative cytochrome P450 [Helianthus annuus]
MELLFMFLLFSLSLMYLLPKIIKHKSRFNPPGPIGLPFIGNLHQINPSSLHTSLWQLSKSYGPIISLRFGFVPTIVVSSPSLAKEVMKTQDIIFCSRPRLVGNQKFSYGGLDVAFSPYDETWRDMRKIFVTHLLSPKRIQSTRFQDENERKKVLGLLDELQETIVDNYVSDIWPGLPFVNLVDRFIGKTDRLEKCFQEFDLFYQQLIDEHLNGRNIRSHEDEDDVVDILLRLMKDKLFGLTHKHIKAMLMNVLAAGTDASAATVVWSLTLLMKNPNVMKKAQEEVRNVIGKKCMIDEDDLPKLTYLKAVINETMRLYPSAPLLVPRETMKDTILHGYKIKQKTIVYVNAFAIGRDPKYWDRPEDFYPERFLGSDIDFKGNDFELIPFGAGRRICPGMLMGVLMVELLLANLLYLFDWGLQHGMQKDDIDLDAMPGVAIHKKNELCLLAHEYI